MKLFGSLLANASMAGCLFLGWVALGSVSKPANFLRIEVQTGRVIRETSTQGGRPWHDSNSTTRNGNA